MPRGNFNLSITSELSPQEAFCKLISKAIELGEKLLGGDKSEAIFAARLLRGYFCREATICLYRATGHERSYEPVGSDVLRKVARESAMFRLPPEYCGEWPPEQREL